MFEIAHQDQGEEGVCLSVCGLAEVTRQQITKCSSKDSVQAIQEERELHGQEEVQEVQSALSQDEEQEPEQSKWKQVAQEELLQHPAEVEAGIETSCANARRPLARKLNRPRPSSAAVWNL